MNVVQLQQAEQKAATISTPEQKFAQFWHLYPRHIAKAQALKMWLRLTLKEQDEALTAIPLHVRHWRAKGTEIEFIPHPGSWLHGKRFEDEITSAKLASESATCATCGTVLLNGFTLTRDGKLCNTCWSNR